MVWHRHPQFSLVFFLLFFYLWLWILRGWFRLVCPVKHRYRHGPSPPHTQILSSLRHTALNIQKQICKVKVISEANRAATNQPTAAASKAQFKHPPLWAQTKARVAHPDRATDTVAPNRVTGESELTAVIKIAIIIKNSHLLASPEPRNLASKLVLTSRQQ